MNKLLLALVGLIIINFSFAQKEFNNTKTEKHRHVKGTKLFLVPPSGFVDASNFQGFQQNETSSSILIVEVPGPFIETTKGFNEQGLKTQNVVLKKKEEIKINGYSGLFITSEQVAYGHNFVKYILAFGDSKTTFLVNGMFPKDFPDLDKGIKDALYSVIYESDLKIDPLTSVNFQVDINNTKLKFAKLMSGSLLYTVDGNVPTESNDKTTFIAGQSISKVGIGDKKDFSINRLKQMPYDIQLNEEKILQIEIDGISGYEIQAQGTDKRSGSKDHIYQVILFTDNGYYIMLGTAKTDIEKNIELFKKIAQTFKRR